MIELTQEQHESLAQHGVEAVRVIDRATNAEYVLIPAETFERMVVPNQADFVNTATLINEMMAEDDAADPFLESYQKYAQEAALELP